MNRTHENRRTIRSFVKRAGRLTPSQQKALSELWPEFGVGYSPDLLNLDTLFGKPGPKVLEIGFGNGETLVQQAEENPDKNFLGIEVHEPGIGHCLLRARNTGVENLRLIAHDAIEVLTHQIPHASLSRVNLYFPDPWPKKRHHKRRIVQADFLDLIADRLNASGTLNIATDWADYVEHIDDILSRSARFDCAERRQHDGDQPIDRPRTKFELRGINKGHKVCDWFLVKSTI